MKPYEECPQFDSCSCNACPLDPAGLHALPGEEPCRATRRTRVAIAERYGMAGLTQREIVRDQRRAKAKARFEAMTPEQRLELEARLKRGQAALSLWRKTQRTG